ncbi:MAG: DNA primase [Rickettsiales bacterium]|nr:DNA primase [Rickettsiales bacterium]
MKYSQELIQKIKDSVPISSLIGSYVKLISYGNMRYKGLCPFHNEKTPSFTVSDDKANYHCFGCGAHGDVISFLQDKENLTFNEAVEKLAVKAAIPLPRENVVTKKEQEKLDYEYEIIASFNEFFKEKLQNSTAFTYLTKRQIPEELRQEFQLGYAPSRFEINEFVKKNKYEMKDLLNLGLFRKGEKNNYFFLSERLIFPIHNHFGKIVAFGGRILGEGQPKYINSPEYKFFKKREVLYNFHKAKSEIRKTKQVFVCEGYMDVISVFAAGIKNVVAPLGTAFSEAHLKLLWQFCDAPVICLDGDQAGINAMQRIANLALPDLEPNKTLNFVVLPENMDPDDILKKNGIAELNKIFKKQIPLSRYFLNHYCDDAIETPEARIGILQELQNIAKSIKHNDVRDEYFKFFKEEFYKFYHKKHDYSKYNSSSNLKITRAKLPLEEVDMILFVALNIESLQDSQIEENFAMLELSSPYLTELQEYLLQNLADFNMEEFRKIIIAKGKNEFTDFFIQKLNLLTIIENDSAKKNIKYEYLTRKITLAKLKQEYKENINSTNLEQENLAFKLQQDIQNLEMELNEYLNQLGES